ncbi:U4/U6.U5 tri-snRNP-associated protein 1-like [Amphiura filiformis]|uniref:U4/U6.U5 tri-snRNP-associated protein 1-like n=1 Tax=Amphiura filiformis TaxID=82378 RepID=UPI003B20DC6B
MGSSKKHKEKDKDREERRHKHKEKDKDRDKDREKKHKHRRHRSRSKDRDESSSRRKRRSPSLEVEGDVEGRRSPDRSKGGSGGKAVQSLSIEETNKIRAKLGLPPLEDSKSPAKKDKESTAAASSSSSDPTLEFREETRLGRGETRLEDGDVHKPAVNLREQRKANEIKEKLALIKEKRQINKKLKKVKTLGDDDDEDDDAHAWIEKSRKKQQEKEKAEKKAKMLAEMDEEFGIGSLVQDQMKREREEMYTAKNISGMRVVHSKEAFKEGKQVILTLKDYDILGEDDDVLMNYNLLDDEKATKNVELQKKKPAYRAYDEPEYDEFGVFKPRAILDKYDEEIEGAKIESFTLDGAGGASMNEEARMQRIRANLKRQAITLQSRAPTIASEYYSYQEMESFKKPKRRKKIKRKLRGKFTVDELMPDKKSSSAQDHGSRRSRHDSDGEEDSNPVEGLSGNGVEGQMQGEMDMELDLPNVDQGTIQGPDFGNDTYLGPAIDDEAENELQMVLHKARKLKQKRERKHMVPSVEEKVAGDISQIKDEPTSPVTSSTAGVSFASSIVLNSTSEFCRQLGDIPTYGTSGNREDEADDEEMMAYEQDSKEYNPTGGDDDEGVQAWSTVNLDKREEEEEEDEQAPVLEEEPALRVGVAGALQLAVNKGYLADEEQNAKGASKQRSTLESQNFMVEEKNYNDIDAKYSKHDRFRGPITDFKEKPTYKPDVKLEYIDDSGRLLNQKEAFRQLSHRFHGKGSGKMKTEKRLKKWQEEEAMKKMSSTDTPLGTVAMMQEKQRQMQLPYVYLSGGSKALSTNSITK